MTKSTITIPKFQSWRFLVFYAVMAVIFGFYAIRLFNLQIVRGAEFHARAEDNRTTTISVQTNRGIIYDRNGFVLARNVASYNIVITPAFLPSDAGAVQEIYRSLSTLIDVPVSSGVVDD